MALYTIAPVTEIGEQAICTNESREMDSWNNNIIERAPMGRVHTLQVCQRLVRCKVVCPWVLFVINALCAHAQRG